MISIGEINENDDCFSFGDGKVLGFKDKMGKWNKGWSLQIVFVGHIKHFKQWSKNFSLDLIPLTREGFVNAKFWIEKYSECKQFHSLCLILILLSYTSCSVQHHCQ